MATSKRSKPASAGAASELQFIEQFGRPLAIRDSAALQILHTACRNVIFISQVGEEGDLRCDTERQVRFCSFPVNRFWDTAWVLTSVGCRPDAIIAMRRRTSISDDLRALLGIAAKLTVDETRTGLRKMEAVFPVGGCLNGTSNGEFGWRHSQEAEPSRARDRRQTNQDRSDWLGPAEIKQPIP